MLKALKKRKKKPILRHHDGWSEKNNNKGERSLGESQAKLW